MNYEWDPAKASENRRKHGVDFVDAIHALEDPNRLEEVDDRRDYGEERMIVVGLAHTRVLFVVTTTRGEETCRIISARKATRDEQDQYYSAHSETW